MTQEALKLALEALESCDSGHISDGGKQWFDEELVDKAYAAIKEALAQPEQEPVAWMQVTKYGNKLLAFTEPPLEPPCYTGEFIAAKNYPLFLKKENT
jgi:hypothetical protein